MIARCKKKTLNGTISLSHKLQYSLSLSLYLFLSTYVSTNRAYREHFVLIESTLNNTPLRHIYLPRRVSQYILLSCQSKHFIARTLAYTCKNRFFLNFKLFSRLLSLIVWNNNLSFVLFFFICRK